MLTSADCFRKRVNSPGSASVLRGDGRISGFQNWSDGGECLLNNHISELQVSWVNEFTKSASIHHISVGSYEVNDQLFDIRQHLTNNS